jgi:hypothetical protein
LNGFPVGWAHQLRIKDLIFLGEARYREEHISGVISTTIEPFCISCLRVFFCISILLFSWAYLLKKGAKFLEEDLGWKVISEGLIPYFLHMQSNSSQSTVWQCFHNIWRSSSKRPKFLAFPASGGHTSTRSEGYSFPGK